MSDVFYSFDSVNYNTERAKWTVRATFYAEDANNPAALVPLTDLGGIPIEVASPSLTGIKDALNSMAVKIESSRAQDVLSATGAGGGEPVKYSHSGMPVG